MVISKGSGGSNCGGVKWSHGWLITNKFRVRFLVPQLTIGGVPMSKRANDVEAQVLALLDIVNNNYIQAIKLVCDDIEVKESCDKDL